MRARVRTRVSGAKPITMTRARLFGSLLLGCVLACADEGSAPSVPQDPPAPEPGDSPPCTPDSRRQHAFLADGTCSDVPGSGGTWVTRALFPDAPPDIRERACTYRWSNTSAPDVDALRALTTHMTASCEPEATTITPRGSAVPVTPDTGGVAAPTGVSGCDVCGRVYDKSAYLILPADRPALRRMVVEVEGGTIATFDLAPPPGSKQAFVVDLPPAAYVFGQVTLVEATSMK